MAGRGPAPKPKDQRRNRAAPRLGEWITLPAEKYTGPVPALPRIKGGYQEATKKVWASWWMSPMAHMWTEADWVMLQNAIAIQETFNRALTSGKPINSAALAQQRLLLDGLGLTPKGRQERRWRLPDDDTEGGVVMELVKSTPPDPPSRRRRIRAVDPDLAAKPTARPRRQKPGDEE